MCCMVRLRPIQTSTEVIISHSERRKKIVGLLYLEGFGRLLILTIFNF